MKYLMVSTYPPMRCGIGMYAFQMVRRLRGEGHIVEVFSPEEGDGDFTGNLRGGLNLLRILPYSIFYDRVILQYHESFFYEERSRGNLVSIAATHLSFLIIFFILNAKMEVIVHELPRSYPFRLDYIFENLKWHMCPKLIFHTEREVLDFEQKFFRLSSTKYKIQPPASYYDRFRDIGCGAAREELGIPPDSVVFLCIGFIQPHKGFDRAIKAFSNNGNRKFKLFIVGSLRVRTEDNLSYLQELVQMAGRTDNVQVVERYLPDEEFDTWISASNVVVIPYREIWSSAVVARAKLFSKPVIASDVGGLKEQITDSDILFRSDEELKYIFKELAERMQKE
jgi:glycosyltransferase involved in cell wall biosynthesis